MKRRVQMKSAMIVEKREKSRSSSTPNVHPNHFEKPGTKTVVKMKQLYLNKKIRHYTFQLTPDMEHMDHGVLALQVVVSEVKQDHDHVLLLIHVVHLVLDQPLKQDLVAVQ